MSERHPWEYAGAEEAPPPTSEPREEIAPGVPAADAEDGSEGDEDAEGADGEREQREVRAQDPELSPETNERLTAERP